MKTFEELKQDFFDASQAYQNFIKENSRELTDEEKLNDPDYPILSEIETKPYMFELTVDKLDEFNTLHKILEAARKKFSIEIKKKKEN